MEDPHADPMLRAFLAQADAPCPGCGYNLRGLRSGVCPECSQALVLRVGLFEPRMRLYIAGMVGLAAGAGFSGLLLLYALTRSLISGGGMGSFWNFFILITAAGAAVEGAMLGAWLWRGAWIRRRSLGIRQALVAAAWAVTLSNLTAFVIFIR